MVKGVLGIFGEVKTQNFDIYNINDVIIQTFFHSWINKSVSEENMVPRALFEAREVTGSATYKQSKTVWIN